MTRDDIIRMAREAGISVPWDQEPLPFALLERFAEFVAAAEREACAKLCESQRSVIVESNPARVEFDPNDVALLKCALLIRERGNYE
jgi:hypothetical protein